MNLIDELEKAVKDMEVWVSSDPHIMGMVIGKLNALLAAAKSVAQKNGYAYVPTSPAPKRWRIVCKTCAAFEEGDEGEIPLHLHGRFKDGQWQHFVNDERVVGGRYWCGPVVEEDL
jgi:hypothetical protein